MKSTTIPFIAPGKISRTALMLLFSSAFLMPVISKEQIMQHAATTPHQGAGIHVSNMLDRDLLNCKLKLRLFQSLHGISEPFEEAAVNNPVTHQPIRILVD